MQDRNIVRMAWFGIGTVVALLIVVGGQLYAGESDAGAKRAACEQAKSGLTYLSTASITDHREGTGDAHQRNGGEQTAGDEKRRVEAIAACAAAAGMVDRLDFAIMIFLRTLGPFVGVMAFFLGGLRYDAGRRQTAGGGDIEFVPPPLNGSGRWTVRNVGSAPETVDGVLVVRFPLDGPITGVLHAFETLKTPKRLEPGETLAFDTTCVGDDLFVGAMIRRIDAERRMQWARFRLIDPHGGHEQREDGRLQRA